MAASELAAVLGLYFPSVKHRRAPDASEPLVALEHITSELGGGLPEQVSGKTCNHPTSRTLRTMRETGVIKRSSYCADSSYRKMGASDPSRIRNFSIVAHIDHGKSTLADRLIERAGNLSAREMRQQVLDSMELERERGITIKAQTVRLPYRAKDGCDYVLNLIDTPGHVDFGYEVSRSMRAVEGSLLVVDASQGVEAQTLANAWLAIDANHEIVPVLNKIDLPAAEPERVTQEIEEIVGVDTTNALKISAKTGEGISEIFEAIVTRLPPPGGSRSAPLQALLVDSWYDSYLGVVVLVRVVDGVLQKGAGIRLCSTGTTHQVDRVGYFQPKTVTAKELGPGEIGFLTASIKSVAATQVGDTITEHRKPCLEPLPGFKPAQPVVFLRNVPDRRRKFWRLA